MEIVDQRKGKYSQLLAVEVLNKLINATAPEHFIGIKRIILFDSDYKKENAIGRRLTKKGSALSEIEIMLDAFDDYPEEMLQNEVTIAFVLGTVLFHEIYHHIRYRNKLRALKHKKKENEADFWALKETVQVLKKLYDKEDLLAFKEKYYKLVGWQ